MSRILSLRAACALILALLYSHLGVASASAQSQASSGQIVGTVKDPGGAAVPNVAVTVSNPDIGFSQSLMTNEVGEFRALLLKPGYYTVEPMVQGFCTFNQPGYLPNRGTTERKHRTVTPEP